MATVDPTIASWQVGRREIGMLEFAPTEFAAECFPYWQLPERCGDDDDLADDESTNVQMREKCTELVGGNDYAAFMQLFFWA